MDGREPAAAATPASLGAQAMLAFAVYYLARGVAVQAFGAPGDSTAAFEQRALAASVGLAVVVLFAAAWRPAVRLVRRGVLVGTTLRYLAFLVAWIPLAMMLYPWLLRECGHPLEAQSTLQYFLAADRSWRVAVVVVMACVLAPVVEEIVFRGYLQTALAAVLPRGAAVVVTAMLFGAMHEPEYALPVGLLGLLFGVLKERYGCLLAPVVAHVMHNSLTVLITACFPETLEWTYR